jgi:hypothetical protein
LRDEFPPLSALPGLVLRALREVPFGLLLALGAGFGALLAGWVIADALGIPASALVRDPAAIARHPFYYGFFSNLGVLLWSATAGALWVAGLALRGSPGDARRSSFLLWFAATTTLLGLDDVYMLHEDVYRRFLPGSSVVPLALYASLLLAGLMRFHRQVLDSDFGALAIALSGFGVSALFDVTVARPTPLHHYLEDGAKLLGIIAWAGYFGRESVQALRQRG